MGRTQRGTILPVVLLVLMLLALLVASFSFRVQADVAATQAIIERMQTRLAAEAGIERMRLMLRNDRFDMDSWFDNSEELHRIIVWTPDADPDLIGSNEEFTEDRKVYRFSLVADDFNDDEDFPRFGVIDESSKLNLNEASPAALLTLVSAAVGDDPEVDTQRIVNAILDWRDEDDTSRGEEGESERTYYEGLEPPYQIKNGPFDTVEELLLVKGMTRRILYGEDVDRNGLLTDNEDDGDLTYPSDDQDGILNRGLFAYLTVLSYENNVSNDNKPRIYLLGDEATVRASLSEVFEDDPGVVNAIVAATRPPDSSGDGSNAQGGVATPGGRRGSGETGGAGTKEQGAPADGAPANGGLRPDGTGGDPRPNRGGSAPSLGGGVDPLGRNSTGNRGRVISEKATASLQVREGGGDRQAVEDAIGQLQEGDTLDPEDFIGLLDSQGAGQTPQGSESNGAGASSSPMQSPAELFSQAGGSLDPVHLAIVLDRTTTIPPSEMRIPGLINVNTASRLVLSTIPGLTGEDVGAIIEARSSVEGEEKSTPAWLVTQEVLELDTFIQIAPFITARGQQFTIEALGYGDHTGMVTRLQVVVDLTGPIVQTIYYRDLTRLGGNFPIREEDLEHGGAR